MNTRSKLSDSWPGMKNRMNAIPGRKIVPASAWAKSTGDIGVSIGGEDVDKVSIVLSPSLLDARDFHLSLGNAIALAEKRGSQNLAQEGRA